MISMGNNDEKRIKEEGEKISLRFPQTFESTAPLFDSYQLQKSSPCWLVQVRKPLDGAYAPSMAPLAEGLAAGGKIEYERKNYYCS
jgi:hypothetical protein